MTAVWTQEQRRFGKLLHATDATVFVDADLHERIGAICGHILKEHSKGYDITPSNMEPFDLAQSFIEQGTRAATIQALAEAFQRVLGQLGFRYFACCSHVDPLRPPRSAVMLHNYPVDWVRAYSERKLLAIDPVFRHAERTFLPFYWDAPELRVRLTADQWGIFVDAASQGLAHGYTVPIHAPWLSGTFRASCSVVPDSRSIGARSYFAVQLMSTYLYDAARRRVDADLAAPRNPLSSRERQCLELVAQGKASIARLDDLRGGPDQDIGIPDRRHSVLCGGLHSYGDLARAKVYGLRAMGLRKAEEGIRHQILCVSNREIAWQGAKHFELLSLVIDVVDDAHGRSLAQRKDV